METPPTKPRGYRFGSFELDLGQGELRKNGIKVKLQDKPLIVLGLLLERPNELVTREEVQKRLWEQDTFVDFEKGLNTAIYTLREALGDDAENPRFVQTAPKKGYRFIAPVEAIVDALDPVRRPVLGPAGPTADQDKDDEKSSQTPFRYWKWVLGLAAVLAVILAVSRIPPNEPPARVMLAVLLFENLSGDDKQAYLPHGLTDELITHLSAVNPEKLAVIGYTTVSDYKRRDPIKIGQELNVKYVVEGSVRPDGERFHINVRLVQTRDGTTVWTKSYDSGFSDFPAALSTIAEDIATGIQIQLQPRPKPGAIDVPAYQALLRGRYFMSRRTDEDLKRGVESLQLAVAKDPKYALAHASLAEAYNLLGFYSVYAPRQAYPLARHEAQQAIQLAPMLADAHTALGDLYIYEWNWAGAEHEFQRALSLSPNDPQALQWYGMFLAVQGRNREAIELVRKAMIVDPLSIVINADLGLCYYYARDYERALEQYTKTLELDKRFSLTHNWMGLALVQMKRYDEAIAHFKQAVEYSGGNQGSYALLTYGLGMAGRKQEAAESLRMLEELAKTQYVSPIYFGVAYIGLGNFAKVREWAEKALEDRAALMIRLKVEPVADPVRGEPWFPPLLKKMGLTP